MEVLGPIKSLSAGQRLETNTHLQLDPLTKAPFCGGLHSFQDYAPVILNVAVVSLQKDLGPNIAIMSSASSIPQTDLGSSLGPYGGGGL